MRVSLNLERVLSRGTTGLHDPVLWPVWFAADDAALRYLAGDPAATVLHAPGPAPQQGDARAGGWDHRISNVAVGPDNVLIGFGLLVSSGGIASTAARDAYQDLTARLHALALTHAAHACGLGGLLVAFGGSARYRPRPGGREALLDRLRDGVLPEELADAIDPGVVTGITAFRGVGEALARSSRLAPQTTPTAGTSVQPGTAPARPASPVVAKPAAPLLQATRIVPAAPELPTARLDKVRLDVGRLAPVVPTLPDVPPGTIVAATVQAWRQRDLPAGTTVPLNRPLAAVGASRASLVLSGSIRLEA